MSPENAADREARMARAASTRRADRPQPPGRSAVRTRPVRTTVDMDPELHRQMKAWATAAAAKLDMVDVSTAAVIRALLRQMLRDPALEQAVLAELNRLRQ